MKHNVNITINTSIDSKEIAGILRTIQSKSLKQFDQWYDNGNIYTHNTHVGNEYVLRKATEEEKKHYEMFDYVIDYLESL